MHYRRFLQIYTILFISLITLLTLSCTDPNTGLSKSETQKITTEIQSMLDAYHREVGEHGLAAEFKFLDSTKQFSWHPAGYEGPIDYDSVAAVLHRLDDFYTSIQSHWDTLTIVPLSDSMAQYTGEFTTKMTDVTGYTDTYTMHETGTLIKRADGWKMMTGKTSMLPRSQ